MIVLDASAVVDALLNLSAAPWVRGQVRDEEILAPAHQPAEVLSALARLIRAGKLTRSSASDALTAFQRLDQQLLAPTPAQLGRALDLDGRIRVQDALYVALAEEYGCALVTTDRRLARSGVPVEIRVPD